MLSCGQASGSVFGIISEGSCIGAEFTWFVKVAALVLVVALDRLRRNLQFLSIYV